jgi:hypothetical protein
MLRNFVFLMIALFATAWANAQEPAAATPAPAVNEAENILHLDLSTGGRVSIKLFADVAPAHVDRIKTLTRQGFLQWRGIPPRY